MYERPTAAELLESARQVLLEDLLPALPPERKYEALMLANVMALTLRELDAGDLAVARQLRRLEALYSQSFQAIAGASEAERLALLEKRLAQDIRAGRFDDSPGGPLREALLAMTQERLRISNPKYLHGWESALERRPSE